MKPFSLVDFVRESNLIERIARAPRSFEVEAHEQFLALVHPRVEDLEAFVQAIQPRAAYDAAIANRLRTEAWMNVTVGGHTAPRGGPNVRTELEHVLLRGTASGGWTAHYAAFTQHVMFERLHPFMDGNGRAGRVLWLHTMGGIAQAPRGFLTHFYFQALSETGRSEAKGL